MDNRKSEKAARKARGESFARPGKRERESARDEQRAIAAAKNADLGSRYHVRDAGFSFPMERKAKPIFSQAAYAHAMRLAQDPRAIQRGGKWEFIPNNGEKS